MKVSPPQLPVKLEPIEIEQFLDGDAEDMILQHAEAVNRSVTSLDISSTKIEHSQLVAGQFERCNARDFVVIKTDLSAVNFSNSTFNRVEFTDCRMSGLDFSRTSLHDVIFKGCKLDMANLRFADLRRVRFIDCTLSETDFLNARLVDVTFEASTLEKTIFERASCKKVDFRTSELNEIIGWKYLKDTTIDPVQLARIAPHLAHELGITVAS